MADNNLRILLSASLNKGSSIGDINKSINEISKHPSLQKIKIKLEIDTKLVNLLTNFTKQMNSLSTSSRNVNNSMTQTTQQINYQTQAINQQTKAQQKLNLEKSKKIIDPATNKQVSTTSTYGNNNNNNKQTVTTLSDGSVKGNIIQTSNLKKDIADYNKMLNDAYKMNESFNKKAEALDRAHYEALKSNKARYEAFDKMHYQALQRNKEVDNRRIAEATKIDRDHYNALRTNQQRIEAMDKQHYLALQQNSKRETDFQKQKADTLSKITDMTRRFGSDSNIKTQLDNLQIKNSAITSAGNYKKAIGGIQSELKLIGAAAQTSGSHVVGMGEQFKIAMSRFPIWIAASTIVMGSIHQITSGITYIKQFDDALVELLKVVNLTDGQIKEMSQSAINLGKELGKSSTDVMHAFAEFGRQFKDIEEIKDVTTSAILASNVSTLSAAEAAKTLTTAMIAFNIEAKDSIRIVDSMNEIQNNYRITAGDLADSLSKVGSMAKLAGSSMESLEGITTSIVASTGISGNEAGTAIKGFISRMFRLGEEGEQDAGKSEALLKTLGIEIRKSATEFKSFDQIISEINGKWSTWGNITQQNVAQQIGSQYHVSKFIALMDNFQMSVDATNTALNSQGSAMKENEVYLNSISGKWQIFKTTLEEKWGNTLDSGAVKNFISGLTVLIDKLGNLYTVLLLVGTGFAIFKGVAILKFFKDFNLTLMISQSNIVKTQASLVGMTAAEIAAMSATRGLGFAMKGLWVAMAANPIGLILTAVTLTVTAFQLFGNTVDDSQDKMDKLNEKYDDQKNQLNDLRSFYEKNHEAIKTDTSLKDQLFEMQNKLIDTFGKEAEGIDLVNGKYDEQIKKIDALNKKSLDNKIADNQILVDSINDRKFSDPSLGGSGTKSMVGLGSQSYSVGGDSGFGDLSLESYYNRLLELQDKIRNKNTDIFVSQKLIPKSSEEWVQALAAVQTKVEKIQPLYDQINSLENDKKERIKSTTVEQAKFNTEQQKMFDTLNGVLKNQPTEEYSKNISSIVNAVKNANGGTLSQVVDNLKQIPEIQANDALVKNLNDIQVGLVGVDKASPGTANATQALEDMSKAIDNAKKALQPLNQAIYSVQKGQKLSTDSVLDLIAQYPELSKAIHQTAEGWTVEKSALEAVRQAQIDQQLNQIDAQSNMSSTLYQELQKRLEYYGIELSAIISITDANERNKKVNEESQKLSAPFMQSTYEWQKEADQTKSDLDHLLGLRDQFDTIKKSLSDPNLGVPEATKDTKALNDTFSETNEVLTVTQKKLQNIETALQKMSNERAKLTKGSAAYRKSLEDEIKLYEQQIKLNKEGQKDPSKLVSTKVTTSSKSPSGIGSSASSGSSKSNIDSLLSAASGLQGNFKYKQVPGEFKGSFDQFVSGALSDCSQFVQEMFKEFMDINLPRTASQQAKLGTSVSKNDLKKGDLVFFNTTGKDNSHVGVYMGDSKFIQMGNGGLSTQDLNSNYWTPKYQGAKRLSGVDADGASFVTTPINGKSKTSTKNASQSDIDKALETAAQNISDAEAKIYQAMVAIIDNYVTQTQRIFSDIEAKISDSEFKQSKLDPNSSDYRKENTVQDNLLKSEQDAVAKSNVNIKKLLQEKKITSGDFDEQIAQNHQKWQEIQTQRDQLALQYTQSYMDKRAEAITKLGDAYKKSQQVQSLYRSGTQGYIAEEQNQIKILKDKEEALHQENEWTRKRLADNEKAKTSEKLTTEQVKLLTESLKANSDAWFEVNNSILEVTNTLITKAKDALSSIIDTLKNSINLDEIFDYGEFNDSIDSIIQSLNEIDKSFMTAVGSSSSTGQTRSDLIAFGTEIRSVANQVSSFAANSSTDFKDLASQIKNQVSYLSQLKSKLTDINNVIRDRESLYQSEENSLENNIKIVEDSYDNQIEQQNLKLKNLDEEIAKEDRLKSLRDINDEIDKVKEDKRFSFITQSGEEILTYDRARVDELEKQKDELVKQYQRDDVKKAVQDEIDRLQASKTTTIKILQDQLDKTKQIHSQELNALRLYQSNLSSLYQALNQNTEDKLSSYESIVTTGLENGTISAEEGTSALQGVIDTWMGSSLTKWSSHIGSVNNKLSELRAIYAAMAAISSTPMPTPSGSTSTPSSSGSSSSGNSGRFKETLASGATWIPGAGGYVDPKTGQVVRTDPAYYHTGKKEGSDKPLAPGEIPSIIKLGETIFTSGQMDRLKDVILKPANLLNSLINNFKMPNVPVSNKNIATSTDTVYQFNGDITVKANNPMEFFEGLSPFIKRNSK
jgi:TP901 family phage tail tape measure protein